MTVYRLPFDDDGQWTTVPQGNWDDPATTGHQPYGFDFAHPVGGTIRAARGGEVVFVENNDGNTNQDASVPGYGTAVLVRHVDGTVAAYDHLKFNSTKVVKTQQVLQGDVLGLSGNTGQSGGPHLHFDARSTAGKGPDAGTTTRRLCQSTRPIRVVWLTQNRGQSVLVTGRRRARRSGQRDGGAVPTMRDADRDLIRDLPAGPKSRCQVAGISGYSARQAR